MVHVVTPMRAEVIDAEDVVAVIDSKKRVMHHSGAARTRCGLLN
jgi:hypothetical protein